MLLRIALPLTLPVLWLLAVAQLAPAAESAVAQTTITIDGLHCQGCARKVASKLKAVAGVRDVRVDAESGTAVVIPVGKQTVSPRAMWEAVEKARYTPVRLVGPSGTFTKKPRA